MCTSPSDNIRSELFHGEAISRSFLEEPIEFHRASQHEADSLALADVVAGRRYRSATNNDRTRGRSHKKIRVQILFPLSPFSLISETFPRLILDFSPFELVIASIMNLLLKRQFLLPNRFRGTTIVLFNMRIFKYNRLL